MEARDILIDGVDQMTEWLDNAIKDLNDEQANFLPGGMTTSIGFNVWHVARTADNITNFVMQDRKPPLWLSSGYVERLGLPKVDQGTGMDPNDAYSMTFPEPAEFSRYTTAVHDAVVPRIAAMSDAYLAEVQTIRPWGPIPRMEAILHGLIGHGNGHLGRASFGRTLYGLEGLPY